MCPDPAWPRRVAPEIDRVGTGTCYCANPGPDAGSTATTAPGIVQTAHRTTLEAMGRAPKTTLPGRGTKQSILRQSSVASGAFDLMNEARLGFRKLLEPFE